MKPKRFDFDPADVDANGLFEADSVTTGAIAFDGALTSGGTFTSADGLGRQIGIASAGDDSGKTFVVTGTDPDGNAQVENVTGANADTAETTGYFLTVSSITISANSAGNVTIGTVDEWSSPTIPLNYRATDGASVLADITGTINYDVQECFDDFQGAGDSQDAQWSVITAFDGKTADVKGAATRGATGLRVIANSYTNGAEVQLYVSQP